MKIDNTHKIKKTIVFLKNKIIVIFSQKDGLKQHYKG